MSIKTFFASLLLILAVTVSGCQPGKDFISERDDHHILKKGTQLSVTLQTPLNSSHNERGEEFTTILTESITRKGTVLIKKGTPIKGLIKRVDKYKNVNDQAALVLLFDRLEIEETNVIPMWASLDTTQGSKVLTLPGQSEQNVMVVGGFAVTGALMAQAAAQGDKDAAYRGLLVGYTVGTGSVILRKRMEVNLPSGTKMRIRLEDDLHLPKQQ